MQEKILVPLDGSEVGESALNQVEDLLSKLAHGVKTEITLLQVLRQVHPPVYGGYGYVDVNYTVDEIDGLNKKALDYLNEVGEVLQDKGATVIVKVVVGDAAEEIIKTADEIKADLIAMSTHGRSGLSRWAFGSVTDKVLRLKAKLPVLIVRAMGPETV